MGKFFKMLELHVKIHPCAEPKAQATPATKIGELIIFTGLQKHSFYLHEKTPSRKKKKPDHRDGENM